MPEQTERSNVKVSELVSLLQKLDQSLEVLCYEEDLDVLADGDESAFFDIDQVKAISGEKRRDDNGRAWLKFGRSDLASPVALIELLADF